MTELAQNEDQLRNLKACVNSRFLVGYDHSKPMEVKPISSFIHDPCEPAEANNKETYDIQPVTQFQMVQYESRREFLGTRCKKYVSQFTYYCGNADHATPLPQETFYRHLKVLAQNECRALTMGQYRAGDGKTYSIAKNVRKEINYFARGSANAYSGFCGSQITCTGGKLRVDGIEVDNMAMYVTEELLYHDQKLISREDDDGIIAHYHNVPLRHSDVPFLKGIVQVTSSFSKCSNSSFFSSFSTTGIVTFSVLVQFLYTQTQPLESRPANTNNGLVYSHLNFTLFYSSIELFDSFLL